MAYALIKIKKNLNPKTPSPPPLLSWKVTRKKGNLIMLSSCSKKWLRVSLDLSFVICAFRRILIWILGSHFCRLCIPWHIHPYLCAPHSCCYIASGWETGSVYIYIYACQYGRRRNHHRSCSPPKWQERTQ
jgi:hypothetical protein